MLRSSNCQSWVDAGNEAGCHELVAVLQHLSLKGMLRDTYMAQVKDMKEDEIKEMQARMADLDAAWQIVLPQLSSFNDGDVPSTQSSCAFPVAFQPLYRRDLPILLHPKSISPCLLLSWVAETLISQDLCSLCRCWHGCLV